MLLFPLSGTTIVSLIVVRVKGLINPFVVLANGGKTTVLEMGVLPRTEVFRNLLSNNSFSAVHGRTKENFSQEIWRLFGENPYLCANKHQGKPSATDLPMRDKQRKL
jgi:hypothetical protein